MNLGKLLRATFYKTPPDDGFYVIKTKAQNQINKFEFVRRNLKIAFIVED